MDKEMFDKNAIQELEMFLVEWCYNNGNPFTKITFSVDSGLKIDNDDEAEYLYQELKKSQGTHDEFIYDDNGNLVGISVVKNEEE